MVNFQDGTRGAISDCIVVLAVLKESKEAVS